MSRHTIEVDDWMWAWAQRQTKQDKPAGYLRGLLGEAIHDKSIDQMRIAIREESRIIRRKEKADGQEHPADPEASHRGR